MGRHTRPDEPVPHPLDGAGAKRPPVEGRPAVRRRPGQDDPTGSPRNAPPNSSFDAFGRGDGAGSVRTAGPTETTTAFDAFGRGEPTSTPGPTGRAENTGSFRPARRGENSGIFRKADRSEDPGSARAPGRVENTGSVRKADRAENTGSSRTAGRAADTGSFRPARRGENTGTFRKADRTEDTGSARTPGRAENTGSVRKADRAENTGSVRATRRGENTGSFRATGQSESTGSSRVPGRSEGTGPHRTDGRSEDTGSHRTASRSEDTGSHRTAGGSEDTGSQRALGKGEATGSHRIVGKKAPRRKIAGWPIACLVLAALIGLGIVGWNWADGELNSRAEAQAASCSSGTSQMRVIVTPSVQKPMTAAADRWNQAATVVHGQCVHVTIEAKPSSQVLDALVGRTNLDAIGGLPAAWLPESTYWISELTTKKPELIGSPAQSVATARSADYPFVGLTGSGIDDTVLRAAQTFREYLEQPAQQADFAAAGIKVP